MVNAIAQSFGSFCRDIKITHSVFALPFAVAILFLYPVSMPSVQQCILLLGCMVAARSWAMGMNRYLDRNYDAMNQRTAARAIPSGQLSAKASLIWSVCSAGFLVGFAWLLNPIAGLLSGPLLIVLALYSLGKRFSWLIHWYLGLCLGLAPVAVIVALSGQWNWTAAGLGLAITFWTGGFDILYALQDLTFDREQGLKSVPARFGVRTSIFVSQISFVIAILLLLLVGWMAQQSAAYFAGVSIIAMILGWEHWLLRDVTACGRSAQSGRAFLFANAMVSLIYLSFVIISWVGL